MGNSSGYLEDKIDGRNEDDDVGSAGNKNSIGNCMGLGGGGCSCCLLAKNLPTFCIFLGGKLS